MRVEVCCLLHHQTALVEPLAARLRRIARSHRCSIAPQIGQRAARPEGVFGHRVHGLVCERLGHPRCCPHCKGPFGAPALCVRLCPGQSSQAKPSRPQKARAYLMCTSASSRLPRLLRAPAARRAVPQAVLEGPSARLSAQKKTIRKKRTGGHCACPEPRRSNPDSSGFARQTAITEAWLAGWRLLRSYTVQACNQWQRYRRGAEAVLGAIPRPRYDSQTTACLVSSLIPGLHLG